MYLIPCAGSFVAKSNLREARKWLPLDGFPEEKRSPEILKMLFKGDIGTNDLKIIQSVIAPAKGGILALSKLKSSGRMARNPLHRSNLSNSNMKKRLCISINDSDVPISLSGFRNVRRSYSATVFPGPLLHQNAKSYWHTRCVCRREEPRCGREREQSICPSSEARVCKALPVSLCAYDPLRGRTRSLTHRVSAVGAERSLPDRIHVVVGWWNSQQSAKRGRRVSDHIICIQPHVGSRRKTHYIRDSLQRCFELVSSHDTCAQHVSQQDCHEPEAGCSAQSVQRCSFAIGF